MSILSFLSGFLAGKASTPGSTAVENFTPPTASGSGELRELLVERESQLVNCAVKYILSVDGNEAGRIANGESLRVQIRENATIMLVCAGMGMKKTALRFRVRAGDHPRIHFSSQYGGGISAQLSGMQVLETQRGSAAYK